MWWRFPEDDEVAGAFAPVYFNPYHDKHGRFTYAKGAAKGAAKAVGRHVATGGPMGTAARLTVNLGVKAGQKAKPYVSNKGGGGKKSTWLETSNVRSSIGRPTAAQYKANVRKAKSEVKGMKSKFATGVKHRVKHPKRNMRNLKAGAKEYGVSMIKGAHGGAIMGAVGGTVVAAAMASRLRAGIGMKAALLGAGILGSSAGGALAGTATAVVSKALVGPTKKFANLADRKITGKQRSRYQDVNTTNKIYGKIAKYSILGLGVASASSAVAIPSKALKSAVLIGISRGR